VVRNCDLEQVRYVERRGGAAGPIGLNQSATPLAVLLLALLRWLLRCLF